MRRDVMEWFALESVRHGAQVLLPGYHTLASIASESGRCLTAHWRYYTRAHTSYFELAKFHLEEDY